MSVKSERKRPFKDVILKEMDIYLTSNLAPKLHVFDFPPGFDPLSTDKTNLLGVKVKLESKRFMMDIKIDTKSRNYDQGKSEQIAYITDHGGEPFFPNNHMNKLILKSNEAKPSNLQYAVGLIKLDSDEIHLTPVNSVIQFKPSFDYFEQRDKKSRLDGPGSSKTGIDSNEEEKKEEDVKKVLVRFETPDEERKKKARESSFSYIRQKIANEPWTDINVSLRQTPTAMKEKENLLFHQPTDEFFNGYNNPDVVMSDDQVHNSNENSISSIEDCLKQFITETATTTCLSSLKRMNLPLSNKIHTIMMKAKVVSLSDLKNLLPDADPVHLIRNLQQFAVIVQGNWVVKSEVLHFKENGSNTSPLTGIPIELLSRARDFILWSFSQENPVSRPELIEKTKIPPEEILHILKETAKFNSSDKLWYFMLPKDTNFIEKYPEVDQRQKLLWDARFVQVNKAYSAPK